MPRFMKGAIPVALLILLAGCSSNSNSSTTAPTPTLVTDTFNGSVDVNGSDFHNFTLPSGGGEIDITLTAAGPPPTIFMRLSVGLPSADGTTCSIFTTAGASVIAQAGSTPQIA